MCIMSMKNAIDCITEAERNVPLDERAEKVVELSLLLSNLNCRSIRNGISEEQKESVRKEIESLRTRINNLFC